MWYRERQCTRSRGRHDSRDRHRSEGRLDIRGTRYNSWCRQGSGVGPVVAVGRIAGISIPTVRTVAIPAVGTIAVPRSMEPRAAHPQPIRRQWPAPTNRHHPNPIHRRATRRHASRTPHRASRRRRTERQPMLVQSWRTQTPPMTVPLLQRVFERVFRIFKLHGRFTCDLNVADASLFPRQEDRDHVAVALV
jgi:hypothetical protein